MPLSQGAPGDVRPLYSSGMFEEFVPDDDVILQNVRAVYTEGAGDLVVENGARQSVTFTMPDEGSGLPISPRRVLETTSVSKVVLFY
jgi:hypothetical protein